MTIKEFADKRGLTKGAIYKAIKSSSFRIDQITGRNGRITEEGREILRILFPETRSEPLKEEKAGDSTFDELRARLSEAESERDEAKRAREKAEDALKAEKEQRALFEKLYNETKEELRRERETADRERTQYKILLQTEQGLRIKAERNLFQRVKVFFLGEKTQPIVSVDSVDTSGEVN